MFQRRLAGSHCYLEYGCGGSTRYAASVARVGRIVSVDTDLTWIQRVSESLAGTASLIEMVHFDIGPVGKWGRPTGATRTFAYPQYMTAPWRAARRRGWEPDTVLIDGRFRVSAFLYSLIAARAGTTILWDDYNVRPGYSVVEAFIEPVERSGRMARFEAGGDLDMPALVDLLVSRSTDTN